MKNKNHNYFKERSLQSIYWAGFIAARGFIHKQYPSVQLKVRLDKEERLHTFLKDVKAHTTVITTSYTKIGDLKKVHQKRVSITSEQWHKDLYYLYNLPTTKSSIFIPNLTRKKEIQAFLLGYLDAGSFIGYRPAKTNYDTFSIILSGHPSFCNWVKTFVDSWFPSKTTSNITIKSEKSAVYIINGKRALNLYNLLSSLPVNKSTKWSIDYSKLDDVYSDFTLKKAS